MSILEEAGPLLYGEQWQSALARELHESTRTLQRWVLRHNPPPGPSEARWRRSWKHSVAALTEMVLSLCGEEPPQPASVLI